MPYHFSLSLFLQHQFSTASVDRMSELEANASSSDSADDILRKKLVERDRQIFAMQQSIQSLDEEKHSLNRALAEAKALIKRSESLPAKMTRRDPMSSIADNAEGGTRALVSSLRERTHGLQRELDASRDSLSIWTVTSQLVLRAFSEKLSITLQGFTLLLQLYGEAYREMAHMTAVAARFGQSSMTVAALRKMEELKWNAQSDLANREKENATLHSENRRLSNDVSEMKLANEILQHRLEKLTSSLSSTAFTSSDGNEVALLKSQLAASDSENKRLREETKNLGATIDVLQERMVHNDGKWKKRYDELLNSRDGLERELASARDELVLMGRRTSATNHGQGDMSSMRLGRALLGGVAQPQNPYLRGFLSPTK